MYVAWLADFTKINTQLIPPSTNFLANLPSGRDIHSPPAPYTPPSLDEDQLLRMRAPPEEEELPPDVEADDSDNEAEASGRDTPGAFPASRTLSRAESAGNAYY